MVIRSRDPRPMPVRVGSLVVLMALMGSACDERPRTYSTMGDSSRLVYEDDFNRAELGANWLATGDGMRIEGGELVVENAKNHPLWLKVPLPDDVRVEFDAWAATESGDIKFELAGDGTSYAKTVSYTASGYVMIFGGWDNKLSIIARRDEHGRDRKTRAAPAVEMEKRYHFVMTRTGDELRWELDGEEFLEMVDPVPLKGPENRYFAFNGWEAETHFDNLKIISLSEAK